MMYNWGEKLTDRILSVMMSSMLRYFCIKGYFHALCALIIPSVLNWIGDMRFEWYNTLLSLVVECYGC